MVSMEAIISYLRADYVFRSSAVTQSMIDRLEHDYRMKDAWAMLERQRPPAHHLVSVLVEILDAKAKADMIGELPTIRSKLEDEYAFLESAAERLGRYFEEFPASETDHPDAMGSVKELNEHIRECRRALSWAKAFIADVSRTTHDVIQRDFPATQKRDSRQTAFATMLCKAINDRFGTPLYSFVATVTDVVYQTNETISPDAVRVAWKRDQAKRQRRRE